MEIDSYKTVRNIDAERRLKLCPEFQSSTIPVSAFRKSARTLSR